MQLTAPDDAELAGCLVGQGPNFVLAEHSRSNGTTISDSVGHSSGGSIGGVASYGSTVQQQNPDASTVLSSAAGSWSVTKQVSREHIPTSSTAEGAVVGGSCDFTVEPTTIQRLRPTAFLLIRPDGADCRVQIGDCDPAIGGLEQVAPSAASLTVHRRRTLLAWPAPAGV